MPLPPDGHEGLSLEELSQAVGVATGDGLPPGFTPVSGTETPGLPCFGGGWDRIPAMKAPTAYLKDPCFGQETLGDDAWS